MREAGLAALAAEAARHAASPRPDRAAIAESPEIFAEILERRTACSPERDPAAAYAGAASVARAEDGGAEVAGLRALEGDLGAGGDTRGAA